CSDSACGLGCAVCAAIQIEVLKSQDGPPVRRGEGDFAERGEWVPRLVLTEMDRRGLGEDVQRDAMVRERVIECEQELRIGRGRKRGELPQAAPSGAGLLFQQDAPAPDDPSAVLGKKRGFSARLFSRERFG